MSHKILVTPRSFGRSNPKPLEMLRERGYELILNPFGRILTEAEMCEAIADADAVIIGVDPLNEQVLRHASKLRAISKYGVGTDNIDLAWAEQAGIPVAVAAGANSDSVADYAMALMLAVARRVVQIDRQCRARNWQKFNTLSMYGKTLGLVGLGAIGRGVARRAAGFGMKILAYDVVWNEGAARELGIEYAPVERILREADFVSLHLPLTDGTRHMIGQKELAMMKPTAVLVNTARGGIVDEAALLEALRRQAIYGAGIDVFEQEPPAEDGWFTLDNVVIGCHCSASTLEAVDAMGTISAQNLIDLLEK